MRSAYHQILVVTADEHCEYAVRKAALNHVDVNNVHHLVDPTQIFPFLSKLDVSKGNLPGMVFLDIETGKAESKMFLDVLHRDYREIAKRSVVLINPNGDLDTIIDFSLNPCVRNTLNKPLSEEEITKALNHTVTHWTAFK